MRTLADEIIYGAKHDVEQLLDAGEPVNVLDEYGFSPLIESAIMGKKDIAELLLKRGATIDSPDMAGFTALHWAVDNQNMDICKLLLEHKANPNAYAKSCQPILAYPVLRGQEAIKELLFSHGGDLNFAQDFINTKLIGHRFELEGYVHIVDPDNRFILLSYEGFFLEFTLGIIEDSLERYKKNYAAKHHQALFSHVRKILDALNAASELMKYLHFGVKLEEYESRISRILSRGLVLVPVAYEGHAITCIKCGNLWVKIDRGYNSRIEGSVVIYKIHHTERPKKDFLKDLVYKKHSREYVNEGLNQYLGLEKIAEMPLPVQVIGNCSWANVEGSVPAMLYLLLLHDEESLTPQVINKHMKTAINFFYEWREWDKDRSLEDCIQSFRHANPARKATKAAQLAAVLATKCRYTEPSELARAEKILPVLAIPEYQYNLKAYLKIFAEDKKTELGDNLMHLLDLAAPKGSQLVSNLVDSK